MAEPEILVEKRGGVAIMTLNRPERMNALVPAMDRLMEEWMPRLREDAEVQVLVLTGAGKGFCSGADVQGWADGADPKEKAAQAKASQAKRAKVAEPTGGLILPFRTFPRPVIGAINGVAAGAGFALAMATDIRIASDRARFSTMFIKRALTPASGVTWAMPRMIGMAKAMELMFTGDWIEAGEAERLGLVNRVVPHDKLMEATLELAERIAKQPPAALELTKRLIVRGLETPAMEPHLELETYYQGVCFRSEDFRESTQAFLEKRTPTFKGK